MTGITQQVLRPRGPQIERLTAAARTHEQQTTAMAAALDTAVGHSETLDAGLSRMAETLAHRLDELEKQASGRMEAITASIQAVCDRLADITTDADRSEEKVRSTAATGPRHGRDPSVIRCRQPWRTTFSRATASRRLRRKAVHRRPQRGPTSS